MYMLALQYPPLRTEQSHRLGAGTANRSTEIGPTPSAPTTPPPASITNQGSSKHRTKRPPAPAGGQATYTLTARNTGLAPLGSTASCSWSLLALSASRRLTG